MEVFSWNSEFGYIQWEIKQMNIFSHCIGEDVEMVDVQSQVRTPKSYYLYLILNNVKRNQWHKILIAVERPVVEKQAA